MKTTNTGAAMMTFKSERAARIAYGKAERAMKATRGAANVSYTLDPVTGERVLIDLAVLKSMRDDADEKAAAAFAVYQAAHAQGFWISSYYFGENTTRDLISANID